MWKLLKSLGGRDESWGAGRGQVGKGPPENWTPVLGVQHTPDLTVLFGGPFLPYS